MKSPLSIGSRVEMFVDKHLIERKRGVALKLHPPQQREVVLITDQPWEGENSACYTALRAHDGRFRLYYRGTRQADWDGDPEQVTCVAESEDGIHFTRPDLGLIAHDGSKRNNIVHEGTTAHTFTPFLDTNPDAKEEERYKAVGGYHRGEERGLWGFVSPDGYRWRLLREEPLLTNGAFDSHNIVFWDAQKGAYRCYARYFKEEIIGGEHVRAIQSHTSPDFLHWSDPAPNEYSASAPLEHFYTNAAQPCPGAEHIYLSFPMRFVPDRKKIDEHPYPGVSDVVFMTSRNGVHWDRSFCEAWLRPGLDLANWSERNLMTACGVLALPGEPNTFSLYISEHFRLLDNCLRRLTVRKHGFASVHCGAEEGEFTTRPLRFEGGTLHLNYSTSAAGSIRVEAQDEAGRVLPGHALDDMEPIFGDALDEKVTWRNTKDLSTLQNQPIRLRFVMRDADLFSLQFKTEE